MSETPSPMAPTILERPRKRGFSFPFLAIIGALLCSGAVMAVQGNGISPVIYFLFAMSLLPYAARTIGRRFQSRRIAELIILVLGAASCSGVAYLTAHPSPEKIFQHVFGQAPPSGVSELSGKKQWYDGQTWLVSFRLNDDAFARLVADTHLERREDSGEPADVEQVRRKWALLNVWSQIAYGVWPRTCPARHAETFHRNDDKFGATGDLRTTELFRDIDSGRVWAMRTD